MPKQMSKKEKLDLQPLMLYPAWPKHGQIGSHVSLIYFSLCAIALRPSMSYPSAHQSQGKPDKCSSVPQYHGVVTHTDLETQYLWTTSIQTTPYCTYMVLFTVDPIQVA